MDATITFESILPSVGSTRTCRGPTLLEIASPSGRTITNKGYVEIRKNLRPYGPNFRTSHTPGTLSPSKNEELVLLRKIENINIGFEVVDENIYFQKGRNLCLGSPNNEQVEVISTLEAEFHGINKIANSLVLVSPKGFQILDSDRNLSAFVSIEGGIGDYKIKETKYLIITEKSKGSWKQSLINPITNSILWSTNEKERIDYSGDSFYVINSRSISKREQTTGNIIWEHQYNKEGFQPITIRANQDYCLVGLLNRDLLKCIDNKTGKEKWSKTSIPKGITIDSTENIGHQLMVNYNSMDLDTGQIIKQKIDREYFREARIENQNNNLIQYKNQLIANDSRSKRTGALDLNNLEIKNWSDGISVPEGYKMKVCNDILYLQGMDKALNLVHMNAK